MRKLESYRIKDFSFDERRWRIDWLGAVTFAERYRRTSQPLIEIQLSTVPEAVSNPDELLSKSDGESRETRQVRLPVAFIPFLRIGDIWEDGYLSESPTHDVGDFSKTKIDRTTTSIIKAGLNADDEGNYYLPWEQHPFHMRHTQSYCILVNYGDIKIVVPAIEVIRFYFGTSGDLISRLFDAPFDETKFWNSATPAERGKNAKIDLASGVSCRSASTAARVAFSPAARHAAEIIGRSCIAATVNGNRAYPKALFPFEGHTDLVASGCWLHFKGVDRGVFLVFRLLSCSHPFPFNGLDYTGERKDAPNGKTNFGSTAKSETDVGADRFSRRTKEPKSVVDEEPDKNKKPRDVAMDSLKCEQFPDLGKKRVAKVDIDFVPTVVMTMTDASYLTGVSVGGDGIDRSMQPVDFVTANHALEAAAANGKTSKFEPAVAVFLELVRSLVSEPRFTNIDIVRLDRRQRHDYLCTLPQLVDEDGVVHPWCLTLYDNGTVRNRKISIARAQEFYATHYILLPEPQCESAAIPRKQELHIISDSSRSILRVAELIAALSTHVVCSGIPNTCTKLGEGVKSIRHEFHAPVDASQDNLWPALATARSLFMAFVRPESMQEPSTQNASVTPINETVVPAT